MTPPKPTSHRASLASQAQAGPRQLVNRHCQLPSRSILSLGHAAASCCRTQRTTWTGNVLGVLRVTLQTRTGLE